MKTIKTLSIVTILLFAFTVASNAQGMKYVKIKTSAQTELCKENIEKHLAYEKGVKDVDLDLKTKVVTVKYSAKRTNEEKLCGAITELGYDANDKKADKIAYSKLPSECKKPLTKSGCGTKVSKCGTKCGSHK